jgi:hypothetical protein
MSGKTEGIACWRLNRFARNVAGAIDDVQRIQVLGGHLAFVEEDIEAIASGRSCDHHAARCA